MQFSPFFKPSNWVDKKPHWNQHVPKYRPSVFVLSKGEPPRCSACVIIRRRKLSVLDIVGKSFAAVSTSGRESLAKQGKRDTFKRSRAWKPRATALRTKFNARCKQRMRYKLASMEDSSTYPSSSLSSDQLASNYSSLLQHNSNKVTSDPDSVQYCSSFRHCNSGTCNFDDSKRVTSLKSQTTVFQRKSTESDNRSGEPSNKSESKLHQNDSSFQNSMYQSKRVAAVSDFGEKSIRSNPGKLTVVVKAANMLSDAPHNFKKCSNLYSISPYCVSPIQSASCVMPNSCQYEPAKSIIPNESTPRSRIHAQRNLGLERQNCFYIDRRPGTKAHTKLNSSKFNYRSNENPGANPVLHSSSLRHQSTRHNQNILKSRRFSGAVAVRFDIDADARGRYQPVRVFYYHHHCL